MCEETSRDGHPMPNSSQFVFPTIVAPETFSRWTTVASNGDWKSSEIKESVWSVSIRASGREVSVHLLRRMADEHVVSMFLAQMLSLIATVIPFNFPRETRGGSSGMTYTSAFTPAFFSLTVRRHENCAVVERARDESLRWLSVVLC